MALSRIEVEQQSLILIMQSQHLQKAALMLNFAELDVWWNVLLVCWSLDGEYFWNEMSEN